MNFSQSLFFVLFALQLLILTAFTVALVSSFPVFVSFLFIPITVPAYVMLIDVLIEIAVEG